MGYSLRRGLTFCLAGSRTVFLDLENDRYFCLPLAAEPAFQRMLQSGGPLDLDDHEVLSPLVARGILVERDGSVPFPDQQLKHQLPRVSLDHRKQKLSVFDSLQALVHLQSVRWKLKRRGAPAMLRLAREKKAPLGPSPQTVPEGLAVISASFDRMSLLLTAHEQCLPRSLALSGCLSAKRYAHEVIIGVKMRPFDAHCWVQVGETVINDTPERTSIFTPILVL